MDRSTVSRRPQEWRCGMSDGQRFALTAAAAIVLFLAFVSAAGWIIGTVAGIGIGKGIALVSIGVSILTHLVSVIISVVEE